MNIILTLTSYEYTLLEYLQRQDNQRAGCTMGTYPTFNLGKFIETLYS